MKNSNQQTSHNGNKFNADTVFPLQIKLGMIKSFEWCSNREYFIIST